MINFPECPASLRRIAHYLKTAQEHDGRDVVVTYWCCLYALQSGLKISSKQPEESNLLIAIMEWLENTKKENVGNEAITNDVVAQAYLENYALKLFTYANQQDLASNFGKNVVKAFYTAGMIYDVLLTFGELSEEAQKNSKYAKWKATYIHNCLKNGETPVPGSTFEQEGEEDLNQPQTSDAHEENLEPTDQQSGSADNNSPTAPQPTIGFTDNNIEAALPSPPESAQSINPGGFQAYDGPVTDVQPISGNVNITAEQMAKAQKYCKWAGSALNYDDTKTAIENLQKALRLLQTGQDE